MRSMGAHRRDTAKMFGMAGFNCKLSFVAPHEDEECEHVQRGGADGWLAAHDAEHSREHSLRVEADKRSREGQGVGRSIMLIRRHRPLKHRFRDT